MDEKRISLPGWRIIRVIGKGSFGCVYEVEKEGAFGSVTHSALKVIHIPETEDELRADRDCWPDDASLTKLYQSRVESVTAEFELMSALKGDSHIVSYEDHSIVQHEHDPGYDIFIRMELLTPLPDYIRRYYPQGVPSDEMVIKLGADICSALERCGKHHIIHRDIKPQNIFVNDNGDFKLGDFGIAKISDHTMSATKTGTYGYMAPEVYKAEPYNSSVDIYSLGIVLYWLLNARSGPFVSLPPAIPNAKQMDDALHRRMYGEPIPAPKYGSKALKRIILKACAFDPKERYQSPAEMRRDLEWLSGDRTIPASSTVQNTVQTPTSEPLPEMENCPFCGTKNKIGAVYCTCCGKPMRKLPEPEKTTVSTPTPQQKKDRKLAWIIAFVAAAFAVIAAVVLIVVLAGKREPSEQAEVHPTAVVSAAPASEATTAPTMSIENQYLAAQGLFDDGRYQEAIAAFEALDGYRDSAEMIEQCGRGMRYNAALALCENGQYRQALPELIALRDFRDGEQQLKECWDHVAMRETISAAGGHTVGVKSDGTVTATTIRKDKDFEDLGQTGVSGWTDMIAVSARNYQTIGLNADGTVVAVGNNPD